MQHSDFFITLMGSHRKHLTSRFINPSNPAWGQGLYRYINDIEAAQILWDIVEVEHLPVEKKFAEEFLMHFCRMKRINPIGALKR